ncbi:hypothetical protein LshimejAT787_1600570 [Lyophyllum shimeji]|uniref:MOSC domain-containing protein n=1 Tax=Lyophyllum shimeji TaxID=47721 RepID=A0A9P3UTE7_LYOSH|nr:hypothetical protein LshimejAT787_1600570 [Lyophyllum shimeji]
MGINLTQTVSSWFSSSFHATQSALSSSSLVPRETPPESDTVASSTSLSTLSKPRSSLEEHPTYYAYGLSSASFTALIASEYPSLHSSELVHLDHAASPPPPTSAISAFASCISSTLYSNPHSHLPTQREVDRMRSRVMQVLFGLGEREQEGWDLVWTSGASASLKLVGEHFAWRPEANYRYLKESHTSLVGIRACALAGGAAAEALDLDAFLSSSGDEDEGGYVLHGYPAQCNVTGSRLGLHPARILSRRKRRNEAVLVDAAAYLCTSPLHFSDVPYEEAPDFVAGSFYKIYGHPTGLGFLLLKRSSARFLTTSSNSRYFGGGAIDALSVSSPFWVHPRGSKETRPGLVHERLENGTIPYLSIVALSCAMDAHERLFAPRTSSAASWASTAPLRAVGKHTQYLADLTRTKIGGLKHWDGSPLVKIHSGEGSARWEEDGPTIAFTLYTPSSQGSRPIGHAHLLNLTTLANIHLRTGGLCNTGVLARVSNLSDREFENLWETGRVCGDGQEFGGETGDKPLGLARISFGPCSSVEDVHMFVRFLSRYFLIAKEVAEMQNGHPVDAKLQDHHAYLQSLVRYPIKSCGGQSLTSCTLTPAGLLHDREFMLIDSATGKTMSQKQFPRMVLIKPSIEDDCAPEVMRVSAEGMPELIVPLEKNDDHEVTHLRMCSKEAPSRPSAQADEWFSKFLGVSCHLHRFACLVSSSSSCSTNLATFDGSPPVPILFSNESPFTLISTSSVDTVNNWIASDHADNDTEPSESQRIHPSCFRANFTISSPLPGGLPPFHEDTLSHLSIGGHMFQMLARCRRCLMICVDQDTGVRMREPFCCLARHRRSGRQRVEFGMHLMWRQELSGYGSGEARVRVGDQDLNEKRTGIIYKQSEPVSGIKEGSGGNAAPQPRGVSSIFHTYVLYPHHKSKLLILNVGLRTGHMAQSGNPSVGDDPKPGSCSRLDHFAVNLPIASLSQTDSTPQHIRVSALRCRELRNILNVPKIGR